MIKQLAKIIWIIIPSIIIITKCYGQDSIAVLKSLYLVDTFTATNKHTTSSYKQPFRIKQYIIPVAMMGYGVIALNNDGLKKINLQIKEEIWVKRPHSINHIDNFLPLVPAAMVYGLNIAGVKGKNNFRDRTVILLMSNVLTTATFFPVKKISKEQRPDASDYYSFPSGHTAIAFVSAEFLYQEYKHLSPWYGISGYAIAAATAYLRMYNNKHWLNDVVAGAGLGIASTKLTYWLYPKIKRKLFKNNPVTTFVLPAYQNGNLGFSLIHNF
jgi:hypothetical protein